MRDAGAAPWDLARHLPWRPFTSPAEKWATQPTFVIGEYLFIGLAVLALLHARKQGRDHVLAWVAALVAGTANDLIFMALPLVDNFWQAQATIMLTPRLPLYIPCVYVCFMYCPTVAVWRLGLPPLSRAAATGLLASIFYAPYDIVGAKFLWWTWHDTDKPIAARILGAPAGSTMWVVTFVATFAWLLGRVVDRDPQVRAKTFAIGLALVAGLSSILMVVQMTALQQLDGGFPGPRGLVLVAVVYAGIAAWGYRRLSPRAYDRAHDARLHAAIVGYFVTLAVLLAVFDPAKHRSASMHQTYGACHVEAKDITGAIRYEFLCAEDFDEDFDFTCVPELPAEGSVWYTACGRAHRNFGLWMAGVAGLGAVGITLFTLALRHRHRASTPKRDGSAGEVAGAAPDA